MTKVLQIVSACFLPQGSPQNILGHAVVSLEVRSGFIEKLRKVHLPQPLQRPWESLALRKCLSRIFKKYSFS